MIRFDGKRLSGFGIAAIAVLLCLFLSKGEGIHLMPFDDSLESERTAHFIGHDPIYNYAIAGGRVAAFDRLNIDAEHDADPLAAGNVFARPQFRVTIDPGTDIANLHWFSGTGTFDLATGSDRSPPRV